MFSRLAGQHLSQKDWGMTSEGELMLSTDLGCRRKWRRMVWEPCWGCRRPQEAAGGCRRAGSGSLLDICIVWVNRWPAKGVGSCLWRGKSKEDAECDHSYWRNQQRVEAIGSWRRGNKCSTHPFISFDGFMTSSPSVHFIRASSGLEWWDAQGGTHGAVCHLKFIDCPTWYALCYILEIRNHDVRGLFVSFGDFVS